MRFDLGLLASALLPLSLGLGVFLCLDEGPLYRAWQRYRDHLRPRFDFLFLQWSASLLAGLHMAVCAALLLTALACESLPLALLSPVLALGPGFLLERAEVKKRDQLCQQMAPWLTILANSLKSSPNIADALDASISLVSSPLREEIDLLVKEVRLGEHLDRAMQRSGQRIASPLYASVMTTLLVARKSGGKVPAILAESATTLREMERLEGVVRAKTAEGKSQTFVLALLPFVVVAALHKVDPSMLPGLWSSGSGRVIVFVSVGLWMASVALARRIVRVDI